MATNAKTWLRWLAMPFAAIVAGAIGSWVVTILEWIGNLMNFGTADGLWFRYVTPIFAGAAFGFCYAWAAWQVAPAGRRYAVTVMLTLFGLLSLVGVFLVWTEPGQALGNQVRTTLQALAGTAAAIACFMSRLEEDRRAS